ncbi:class I SAM-dependent methyltransferase [Mesorhizobium sp.]|uniref:class I SAM-dependent methyltransferase n=1 Tax=Mesorhizobium sp. TaxID=1871066 RepID=UPI0012271F03|nr:class I SAM-dependent methyltransferase [Mesorhizobium sp.]TIN22890.1 MAG: class I SAM-dependent methyltransferase [Mesorhizobium sp.]
MTDTQTTQYYSRNASRYAVDTAKRSMAAAIDRFSALLRPGASVVDIGCGAGRDLKAFRQRGFNVVGLDVSAELASIAAEYSGCPVVIADMREMPFASASFDAAWAAASLLHVFHGHIPAALAEIGRVLKPGGHFFSSVKQGEGQRREADGRLFTYFAPAEWIAVQERSGFSITESTGTGHDPETPGNQWFNSIAKRA